jgi:hypothetical protein
MVIPVPIAQPDRGSTAPPPAASVQKLEYLKFCVIGIWLCAVLRLFTGDAWGGLNTLFSAVAGTFLLKDDPQLSKVHNVLMETPLAVCAGRSAGFACLTPFMFMAGINGVLDFVKVLAGTFEFGLGVLLVPTAIVLLVTVTLQLVAVFVCWGVWKDIMGEVGGGGCQDPVLAAARRSDADEEAGAPNVNPNFVAFQGAGQQLG